MTSITAKLSLYGRLMRLDKPIGSLLLVWPTLWALWLSADGAPRLPVVLIFIVGTVLMRSAGCVVNDYADRDFDPHVARTRNRPLATRAVSVREAMLLALGLAGIAFLLILPIINRLLFALALVAIFLAVSYPYTKRFLAVPQAYLGIAFGFGIPMAYAANLAALPLDAWLLLLANIFWAVAYDTEYAMVDREDDLKIGIKTSAITFGARDVGAVMACYAATLATLAAVGALRALGPAFYLGLLAAAGIAIYHYTLIRERQPAGCFRAFMHNNWFGGAVFAGIAAHYLVTA